MLSKADNELVTRTGPGTACGSLMRGYWQPAALTEELDGDRPVKPVRLMGEDLVLFRDEAGECALVGRRCPHRGADLRYGRLEDGGLRCTFHGWLFDSAGRCLEQPAEPPGSRFREKIRHVAYPCVERNGIVFAWLGNGDPPELPEFDCFAAPEAFAFAFKGFMECNWLQALEVGIDPAHASFLHRFFEDREEDYGRQFGDETEDVPVTRLLREHPCPEIRVDDTGYGLRLTALRRIGDGRLHVRVTNQLFPNAIVIPMSNDMNITQWHVPVDDTHCWWYAIFTAFETEVKRDLMRAQRLELYTLPDYRSRKNRSNEYGFDPEEQRERTFTGMGFDINVHDQWAVEAPGPIYDRTKEHLGASDKGIAAYRRRLIRALGDGPPPPNGEKGPAAIDTIAPANGWERAWKAAEALRRERSAWAAPL